MPLTMPERLEMLQQASKAWLQVKKLIDTIPDRALEKPGTVGSWSGRDLLGHLAGWEAIGIDVVREIEAGGAEEWPDLADDEYDAFNEEMLAPYRAMTTAEVRQALEDTHITLMNLAETAQRLTNPGTILSVTSEHYAKHLDDLRKLR